MIIKIDDRKNVEMLQAYFEDYKAKQDIITMIFELHKYDTDSTVIKSIPFKCYEKQFMEAKIKYDTLMEEFRKYYIPQEYQRSNCYFNVNFDECTIEIRDEEI